MRSLIIIPARFASSRLPGKPLLNETGMPLIQHTYEKAKASIADDVIVATDDQRIFDVVEGFGGKAVMTSPDHESGTARVAEAAQGLEADIIVNMQGDEPETDPEHLSLLIKVHHDAQKANDNVFASTLVCPFADEATSGVGSPLDPSCVKAVLSSENDGGRKALYFSRALVPYPRDDEGIVNNPSEYFMHIGVYAFDAHSLQKFSALEEGVLESVEKLEQLRILEAGYNIAVGVVPAAAPGIDTPEDYQAFLNRWRNA